MTDAKKKALELVEKYTLYVGALRKDKDSDYFILPTGGFISLNNAVSLALIAVEEIVESHPSRRYWETNDDEIPSAIVFWNDVVSELELLIYS